MKKKHYCKEFNCNNEINYHNWKYGKRRCQECYLKTLKGKKHPNYKDGRSIRKYYCKCKKKINWQTAIYGDGNCRFCAKKGKNNPFKNKHHTKETKIKMSKKLSGKNHFNWMGGFSREPYSFEFNNKLKESIRKRDNYQCQNCSMIEEEHLIVIGRNLTIHHIDYNKKNCEETNLITLCISCNFRVNYNRNYWKEYFQRRIKCLVNLE